jgi:hypothetical protein
MSTKSRKGKRGFNQEKTQQMSKVNARKILSYKHCLLISMIKPLMSSKDRIGYSLKKKSDLHYDLWQESSDGYMTYPL